MRFLPELKNISVDSNAKYFSTKRDEKALSIGEKFTISILIIIFLSITFVLLLSQLGLTAAIFMVVALIGIPMVITVISHPRIGIIILLVLSYFINWVIKMGVVGDFKLGTIMDGMEALLIFSFFLNSKFHSKWEIFKTPIAIILLILLFYSILQVANPDAESRLAWLYTVRTSAIITLMYFIFSYYITSISFLRTILYIWMFLTFIGALNAFKQQYFGFFAFEEANFNDPLVQSLLFINGEWRKFSIFSDPVTFSYNMAIGTIFCISIIVNPVNSIRKKALFLAMGCFFTFTMLFSATRASYILLPAAFAFYTVLNLSKKAIVFAVGGAVFMLLLINVPTSNVTLYRFQSAFKPSDDASFNVRAANQKKIQPYIQTHPFGGGLGSTGEWGVKFAPDSFLAKLPPDSGYVRVAVEQGWVGLIIFCSMFFIVLWQGILNYYEIIDPELKSYCLAMIMIIFALNVGSFPQEAIVQFPTNILFYLFLAIINITLKLDKEKQFALTIS